jgi:TonB family protein
MPEAGEILQGKVVDGKFHLGRYLGGSERSAVFLTERLQGAPRVAAIKLIPADPATADLQLSRWNLISRLSHPHVLQVFEAGRCRQDGEEVLYVVMEYAEENLAQILPKRSLTPDEALEMLKPTLEALAYLHGHGFVHGRLKPANIMVASEQLKLSSDGIVRIGEIEGAGSRAYGLPDLPGTTAAPAQDIWSLGVTLVQVLTQLLPVRNGQQEVTLPETLPPQFVDLAHNCLEPDPQRRCTLAEIAEHLHFKLPARTLGPPAMPSPSTPVAAQRPAPARPARATGKKQGRSALPAVAIGLTLLVATFAGWNLLNRGTSQSETPSVVAEQSEPSRPAVTPAAPEAQAPPARVSNKLPPPTTRKTGTQSRQTATLKTASEVSSVAPASPLKAREASPPSPVVPGDVLRRVLPDVSRGASNTIRGTVRVLVKVRVDPAGNVAGVNMISAGPSRYFAQLAADAARQWKFSPAQRDGQAVSSAWNLRFEFIRGGVRATPVAAP